MNTDKIIGTWEKGNFKPVYWFQGESEFHIDQLMQYAEHNILKPEEAGFNLTVFYGKDAAWADILNACRRYPMFAEKQVVLLKEAQQMRDKDLEMLEPYILTPLPSTILVVGYKGKSLDKRTRFSKTVAAHAELFTFENIREEKVQEWIAARVAAKKMTITPKAVGLMAEHIGRDMMRIESELDKLAINLQPGQPVDEDVVEKYVGISKEYNVFELSAAIARKDLATALTILNYFEGNPTKHPIHMVLPALYYLFGRTYAAFGMKDASADTLKPLFGYNSANVKHAQMAMQHYGLDGIEKIILLMNEYNLKSLGVGDQGTPGTALLKEAVTKMILD